MRTFLVLVGAVCCALFGALFDVLQLLRNPWITAIPAVGFLLSLLLLVTAAWRSGRPAPVVAATVALGAGLFVAHRWVLARQFPGLADTASVAALSTRYGQCASLVLAPAIRAQMRLGADSAADAPVIRQYAATVADDACRALTIRRWTRTGGAPAGCAQGETLGSPACYASFLEAVHAAAPFTIAGQVALLAVTRGAAPATPGPAAASAEGTLASALPARGLLTHLKLARRFHSYRAMPAFAGAPRPRPVAFLEETEALFRSKDFARLFAELQSLAPGLERNLAQMGRLQQLVEEMEAEARRRGTGPDGEPLALPPARQREYERRMQALLQGG